jgi:hypothetical protein
MKKIIVLFLIGIFTFQSVGVVHAKGGGSFGGRSSFTSSRSTGSTRSYSGYNAKSTSSKPISGTTKTTTAKTTKTVNGKTYSKTGNVVDKNYKPTFKGGYTPPVGSTVYYRESSSAWDWFPMYYIMTHNGNQQAVVQQPNGQQKTVEQEGGDDMYIWNWIFSILIILGAIGLTVYFVNKATRGGDYD